MLSSIIKKHFSTKTAPNSILLLRPLSSTIPPPSPTVSYLIHSCGLSPESALLASHRIHLKTTQKPDSVLDLFRNHGFTQTHLSKIISKLPPLLLCDANKSLKPKLEFLHTIGFSGPALIRLLTVSPSILLRSLQNHLIPCFRFLHTILGSNETVVAVFSCAPRALYSSLNRTILPRISALREYGLPEPMIAKLVAINPGVLHFGPMRAGELVEEAKTKGIDVTDPMFIYAFHTLSGMTSSTWERKLAAYMEFGLSEKEVLLAFRKFPMCMKVSDEKIRKGMDFYVNRLKMRPADFMSSYPHLLILNLEKTIVPRCSVLSVLMVSGKIKRDLSLAAALARPKNVFLKRYVSKYEEDVPEVVDAYQGKVEFKDMGC